MIPVAEASRVPSAVVEMHFVTSSAEPFKIAQLGPEFLILSEPLANELPIGTRGRVSVIVDGNHREWEVELPEGAASGTRRVRTAG